jgi:formylglycine-generating enzyme required for sulfatase activity
MEVYLSREDILRLSGVRLTILRFQTICILVVLALLGLFHSIGFAQNTADPIQNMVGEWDMAGVATSITILPNHIVMHSRWGRGDIKWDNANYYQISYRDRSMFCHYIIRTYSPAELSILRGEQTDPPECDLGELRRAPGSVTAVPRQSENAAPKSDNTAPLEVSPENKSGNKKGSPKEALSSKLGEPPPTTVRQEALARPGDTIRDCDKCPEVILLPGGSFSMGSNDSEAKRTSEEGPLHNVVIKPFGMGRFPITKQQFSAFLAETGYSFSKSCIIDSGGRFIDSGYSFQDPGFAQSDIHPAVCVSWYDALAYVSWLSQKTGKQYRLPSEAEREYATRAGTSTPYSFGTSISTALANFDPDVTPVSSNTPVTGTMPVASFQPNAFGLYQMHGNVAEWTQDCWNRSYDKAPIDGSAFATGNCNKRVLRGGAWAYNGSALRSAYREGARAEDRYFFVGFRVARGEGQ